MRARAAVPALLGVALLAMSAEEARAQGSHPSALVGAEFRSMSFGAALGVKSVREFVVPIGLVFPVSSRLTIDAGTNVVSAQRTDSAGGSVKLSGVTDVVVRGALQLKPDVAVFTVSVNLPTGHRTLGSNQIGLASALATDLVPFPVTNFGSGFGVTTGLALAAPVGPWALGIAGSYRYTGSYQPLLDTSLTLTPGGEIRVRVGADRIVGQGRVSLGVTYSTFSSDEFGGPRRPGKRVIPQVSWSLPLGNNSLALYAWDLYRGAGTIDTVSSNTITAGAQLALHSGRNLFRPQIEYRQSSGLISGRLIGVAARYQIAAGERLSVVPGARFDVGSMKTDTGASASLMGFSASLMMRTTF